MHDPVTIDFGAPTTVGDLPSILGRFFAWWGGELSALLPWRPAVTGASRQPVLAVRGDRWFLRAAPDAPAVPLDAGLSDTDLAERILQAANGAPISRLTVQLPRESAIVRRIEMPQMSAANVRQAVELQVDRLSPFKADAVRIATRIAGYDPETGSMHVDVAIVPVIRVQPIEQRLRALGLTPAGVDVEGDDGLPRGFDLKEPPTVSELRRRRGQNIALGLMAAAVWIAAIFAWNQAAESEVQSWETEIAALRPAAERSAVLRQDVEGMVGPIARANVHDPAVALNVLQQLTRLLPDSVQVLDLRLESNAVQLAGLAKNAPDLIGLLEASDMFKNVKFVSPVLRKAETGVERFEISMQLETGAAP